MEDLIIQELPGIKHEPKEAKKTIEVIDSRTIPDPMQINNLRNQIETDGVLGSLEEVNVFLGKYSTRSPQELSINIIDGKVGEGTIIGSQVNIQLPAHTEAITQLQKFLESSFGEITAEVAGALVLA